MFGVCTFAYRWSIGRPYYRPKNAMTLIAFIDRMAEYGVKVIQICNNVDLHDFTQDQLTEVRDRIRKYDMIVETGTRGTEPEHFVRHVEIADFLGARVMRVVYDIERDGSAGTVGTQIDAGVACFSQVMDKAREHDVTLALENGYTISPREVREMIERVDHSHFGACLDTLNSVSMVEKAEAVFEVLAPYAKSVHFKDFEIIFNKRGNVISGTALGEGWNDFRGLKTMLTRAGYKGHIFLELYIDRLESEEETEKFEDDCVRRSLDYARTIGLM